MKTKRIQKKTCFKMGLAGAVAGFIAGGMMALRLGESTFVRMASFALYGAMLLFLSATEGGDENRSRRTRLLLLFLALLISYFELPLLCPLLGALVLPGLAFLYRQPGGRPLAFWPLVVCEAANVVVNSLMIMPSYAKISLLARGIALMVVSLLRFWMLWTLHQYAARQPDAVKEGTGEKLPLSPYEGPN